MLGRVGLNISDAIRLFLRQVVVARGLPFEVREVPNAVTQAAMLEARRAYRQAEATSAQLWVSLKYTVNADRRCLEILGG